MHIALVPHVEHQAVFVGLKYLVDGNGQLHHAEIGGKVAAGVRHMVNQEAADLFAQLLGLGFVQSKQIFPGLDRV